MAYTNLSVRAVNECLRVRRHLTAIALGGWFVASLLQDLMMQLVLETLTGHSVQRGVYGRSRDGFGMR
jgi:hypothetical protein